ncbi:hypothetical protein LTR37_015530 [Vermiconidia calcicola]|uniref:Uncharacterized protein n=1 Tax=Vermiconidia calcicola TaxID=1690605 RepID=A0ACC3MQC1_9PEZI|nr:hypothetical protein LTR37_015530 [Vermiconidia calcicola]
MPARKRLAPIRPRTPEPIPTSNAEADEDSCLVNNSAAVCTQCYSTSGDLVLLDPRPLPARHRHVKHERTTPFFHILICPVCEADAVIERRVAAFWSLVRFFLFLGWCYMMYRVFLTVKELLENISEEQKRLFEKQFDAAIDGLRRSGRRLTRLAWKKEEDGNWSDDAMNY